MSAVHRNGSIYFCGGIYNGNTVDSCTKFSLSSQSFSAIANMPFGVNHSSYAADSERFYVVGGRTGGNVPDVGYDYLQIYTFSTDTWVKTNTFPQRRGGMGCGILISASLYVIGGETTDSNGPSDGVYQRVDIYNTATQLWTRGTDLPFGMHGICPVYTGSEIVIVGGRVRVGASSSSVYIGLPIGTTTTTKTLTTTTTDNNYNIDNYNKDTDNNYNKDTFQKLFQGMQLHSKQSLSV